MKYITMGLAMVVMLAGASAIALAQGGSGDNSETTICQSRLEKAQLRAQSLTDGAKQGELARAIQIAREAMMAGNSTKCVVELEKVGS